MALFDPNIHHRALTQWAPNYTHSGCYLLGEHACSSGTKTVCHVCFHDEWHGFSFTGTFLLNLLLFSIFILYVWVFCPRTCMHTMRVPGAQGGPKRASDSLELELRVAVKQCGCWELNPGPLQSSKCFWPLRLLSSPTGALFLLPMFKDVQVRLCTEPIKVTLFHTR